MSTTVRYTHARRLQPDTGPVDRRRVLAAALSAIVPGLGQAANARWRLAAIFLVPSLLVGLVALLVVQSQSPTRLAASLIVPSALVALMVLNVLILAWRLVSVGHAFTDRRFALPPGRGALIGLALVVAFTAAPHAIGGYYGYVAWDTFESIFTDPGSGDPVAGGNPDDDPGSTAGPKPEPQERINVLLLGLDSGTGRSHTLTDTMIVASLDPVGETVSMVSVPRDLVNVPLGDGRTFEPKLNSLLSYANRNKDEFPQGGTRALQDAIGALLGIDIHYYAKVDLAGFVEMVDAVGGIDLTVRRALSDPDYGGYGVGPGWSIEPGRHHLDGANALAYARIRKSAGESDFTRAERQQQVLVAIRNAAVSGGDVLLRLPGLMNAIGDSVRTDVPPESFPELAAMAEAISNSDTVKVVLKAPLIRRGPTDSPYGYVLVADVDRIHQVAERVFSEPGTPPTPWPTPRPSATPSS